jgi:hypothetical protein
MQRAGGVTVTVGLDLLGSLRSDGDHLREHADQATGRVGVLAQLAQDRGELLLVDVVGGEVVLDLLEGQGSDPNRAADAVQARAGTAGHRVVALVVATRAATVSQPWCQAGSVDCTNSGHGSTRRRCIRSIGACRCRMSPPGYIEI